MEALDIIYIVTIVVILLGGLAALHFLLPKEKNFDDKHAYLYRIEYRDGSYKISHKKASFGENIYSIRSKFFYLPRAPFDAEAFCDEATGKDGKIYRAAAVVTVLFPEEQLDVFAPIFQNMSREGMLETVSEAMSTALEDAVTQYEGSEPFDAFFRGIADKKAELFGLRIRSVQDLSVNKISGPDK
ncbi:MAG: hypothetical protein K5876_04740 [Ruminiclostridium sp.]|nr:hypothetical protein [Ruminiclostridium sp.]